MTDDAMRALDAELNGRPSRDDWFGQAREMAKRPTSLARFRPAP